MNIFTIFEKIKQTEDRLQSVKQAINLAHNWENEKLKEKQLLQKRKEQLILEKELRQLNIEYIQSMGITND